MLKRQPEPELMENEEQVVAYAGADFEEAHSALIARLRETLPPDFQPARILDLGCGPGDMTYRLHMLFPEAELTAVDGARIMLEQARRHFAQVAMGGGAPTPVRWVHSRVQDFVPEVAYDLIFSNSLLHHVHEPSVFWTALRIAAHPGTFVYVADLVRPDAEDEARELTSLYCSDEPEVLRRDFYNSLLAAFRPEEVRAQLEAAGLDMLQVALLSDRHMTISGLT